MTIGATECHVVADRFMNVDRSLAAVLDDRALAAVLDDRARSPAAPLVVL